MAKGTILFLPGLAGNEIFTVIRNSITQRRYRLWPLYFSIFDYNISALQLTSDGRTPAFSNPGRVQVYGAWWDTHKMLINALVGYKIEQVWSDWRGWPSDQANEVTGALVSLESSAPVHIVACNQAGLIVRQALKNLSDMGKLSIVGKVVGIGVPHTGYWEPVAMLQQWGENYRLLRRATFGPNDDPKTFLITSGSNTVSNALATWPALYHLFPAPDAAWAGSPASLYDPLNWFVTGVPYTASMLVAAKSYWGSLPAIPSTVPWLDVLGTFFPAPTTLVSGDVPTQRTSLNWNGLGDGQINRRSSQYGSNLSVQTPATFDALPRDSRTYPYINQFLDGTLTESVLVQGARLR